MPVERAINVLNAFEWVNEYIQPNAPINKDAFDPILHFSLMWNLFERNACGREANPSNIKKAVHTAFAEEKLRLEPFQEHIAYFQDRSQRDGMTIDEYLDALKMSNKTARTLVSSVLTGNLRDANNVIEALLLIAHRIRNNLFHGEKDVAMLHNQADLFRAVNSLLATYLDITKNAVEPVG